MDTETKSDDIIKLQQRLERKVKSRGFCVTEEDIEDEIQDAIDFVNFRRSFVATPNSLYDKKYSSLIVDLALSAIAKYGAEGEDSHSENGVSRSYENGGKYPYSLIMQVPPIATSPDNEVTI